MALDPSIALQLKPIQLDNPLTQFAQVAAIQNAQQQNRLAELAYGEKQREVEQSNALNEQYRSAIKPDGTIDRNKLYTGMAGAGLGAKLPAIQKGFADSDKSTIDADKAKYETTMKKFEIAGQIMAPVKDQASWEAARKQTALVFGPEAAAQMPAQYDPALVEQKRMQALAVKDQLDQQWKAANFGLDKEKFGEAVRHNGAVERSAAGTLAVSQGQLGVAQGNLAVNQARETREATMPRGQVIQSEQGTMLVDPRTGTAQPVMANGEPLQPKLKDLPAPIQKAYLENGTAMRKIDSALAAIDAYPDGLGSKNLLGDSIRQRTDPNGVEVRALIADIGSLKIHDRSGAAVTVAEMPRLAPFIPQATDSPATAKKKIDLFKKELQEVQDDIAATYTREQGYKSPQQKVKDAVDSGAADRLTSLKPVSVRTAADYHKLPSGTVYTDPNGTQRTKP